MNSVSLQSNVLPQQVLFNTEEVQHKVDKVTDDTAEIKAVLISR